MRRIALNTFVQRCRATSGASELWREALRYFHSRGIVMISYQTDHLRIPRAPRLRAEDGYPDTWVSHYVENQLQHVDPMPRVAAQHLQPFYWSEVGRLKALTSRERAFMADVAAAGLGDGLAMQVYGPRDRNAYVALGFGAQHCELSAEDIFELECGAQVAHVRLCGLVSARQTAISPLSPREMEVLRWIARGKSNSVIADILGISRHTVDTMMRRMFEKLDVNDRTTAAIRGLGVGLLQISGSEVL